MRDGRVDAGLNASLDISSVMFKILLAIFVLERGIDVITKLDVSHQAQPPATVGLYA